LFVFDRGGDVIKTTQMMS
ncbi:hypothetical protein D046_8376, partial [Vibrio parahaemolyticus V-223/04]